MAFETGKSGNPDGRPKGSRNRITTELHDRIGEFLHNNMDSLQETYDRLSPGEKLKFIVGLLPYVMPKIREAESPVKVLEKSEIYNLINLHGDSRCNMPGNQSALSIRHNWDENR